MLAKVDGQSSHAFVGVLEIIYSRVAGKFGTAATLLCAVSGIDDD